MLYTRSGLPIAALAVTLLVPSGCEKNRAPADPGTMYQYTVPAETNDGWETAALSNEHLDADLVKALFERISNKTYKNIHSVLVVKNGKLVVEEYFPGQAGIVLLVKNGKLVVEEYFSGRDNEGQDEVVFTRDTRHEQHSVTKSVNSILIGIAIDQHLIRSVDEKLSVFFPEYADLFADSAKDKLRLKDLLSMTAGLSWDEWTYPLTDIRNDHIQMNRSNDPVRYLLERPVVAEPGTKFVYNSGISVTLGEILYKVSGLRADQFAERYLFAPLGISDSYWWKYPNGTVQTGAGLFLRPRDMAKIGLLFLHGGRWHGKQIISEEWIRESTTQHAPDRAYGYQWWLGWFRVRDRVPVVSYSAQGRGGQFIFVFPELQMVAVFTGWNDNALWDQPLDMLQRYLLPAATPQLTGPPLGRVAEESRVVIGAMLNIYAFSFAVLVLGALVHLWATRSTPRTKQRIVEVFLLYFLCVGWGVGSVMWSLVYILYPDGFAALIGREPGGPFQVVMGFAGLSFAILGILSIWLRGAFWVAPAVGWSVFLLGAAYVDIRDIVAHGTLSPGAWPVFVFEIAVPLIVLSLLVAYLRLGGMRRAI